MMQRQFLLLMRGIGVVFFLIVTDQMIKKWVINHMQYVCNQGIAFSINIPTIFFVVLWASIVGLVVYFWIGVLQERFILQLAYISILAGGLSNMIDRILYGCVIDHIPFLQISTYNIADILITCGAGAILFIIIKK